MRSLLFGRDKNSDTGYHAYKKHTPATGKLR